MLLSKVLDSVYYNYRESSWERMTNYISEEIKNGNEVEIKNVIDHVRENYSEYHYSQTHMGYHYKNEIKKAIDQKTKINQK